MLVLPAAALPPLHRHCRHCTIAMLGPSSVPTSRESTSSVAACRVPHLALPHCRVDSLRLCHLLCACSRVAAVAGHCRHVTWKSHATPCPLHTQLATVRLTCPSAMSTCTQSNALRAHVQATRHPVLPLCSTYKKAPSLPFVHPTTASCPLPVSHAAASPVLIPVGHHRRLSLPPFLPVEQVRRRDPTSMKLPDPPLADAHLCSYEDQTPPSLRSMSPLPHQSIAPPPASPCLACAPCVHDVCHVNHVISDPL
jgi:hypothetical protein